MDCTRATNMMMKYFDKALSPFQQEEFFLHIKICRKCRFEFDMLQEALLGVEQLKELEVPLDFETNIMHAIDVNQYAKKSSKRSWKIAAGIFALSISAVITTILYLQYGSVDFQPVIQSIISATQWLNIMILFHMVGRIASTMVDAWAKLIRCIPIIEKGAVGFYIVLLSFLCTIFIGIQMTLIALTKKGALRGGGSVYEKRL